MPVAGTVARIRRPEGVATAKPPPGRLGRDDLVVEQLDRRQPGRLRPVASGELGRGPHAGSPPTPAAVGLLWAPASMTTVSRRTCPGTSDALGPAGPPSMTVQLHTGWSSKCTAQNA